jgi:hypothetical protein
MDTLSSLIREIEHHTHSGLRLTRVQNPIKLDR